MEVQVLSLAVFFVNNGVVVMAQGKPATMNAFKKEDLKGVPPMRPSEHSWRDGRPAEAQ